ncbi:MAG: hypothetical protein DRJ38_06370 [Thermoprotei archaeon]|nr:MAG: hypothetical protein DRJ38_06370 [Thermoprotei archaeon]
MLLADYHVHTGYTVDVKENVSIEAYLRKAEKLGLVEICFVNHLEFHPVKGLVKGATIFPDQIEEFIDEVEKAKANTSLRVKIGLEVTYTQRFEKNLEAILSQHESSFDFFLGSIHYIGNYAVSPAFSTEFSEEIFAKFDEIKIYQKYFDEVIRAVESQLFDVLAHPDLIRKIAVKHYSREIDSEIYLDMIWRVLDALDEYNVGLEVNSAGYRHSIGDCYPRMEMLKAARKKGIKVVTIGSDAHALEHLGLKLEKAVEKLKLVGYEGFYVFEKHKPRLFKLGIE